MAAGRVASLSESFRTAIIVKLCVGTPSIEGLTRHVPTCTESPAKSSSKDHVTEVRVGPYLHRLVSNE